MPCTARAPSSEGHTRAHGHPPDAAPHLSRRTWYHCMEPNDPPMSSSHTDSICANCHLFPVVETAGSGNVISIITGS